MTFFMAKPDSSHSIIIKHPQGRTAPAGSDRATLRAPCPTSSPGQHRHRVRPAHRDGFGNGGECPGPVLQEAGHTVTSESSLTSPEVKCFRKETQLLHPSRLLGHFGGVRRFWVVLATGRTPRHAQMCRPHPSHPAAESCSQSKRTQEIQRGFGACFTR